MPKPTIPYLVNWTSLPTATRPVLGGVNQTGRGGLSFTLRFADRKFYAMMPSYRTKGVIPFNRAGQVHLRCFKAKCGRDKACTAKALTIFNDRKVLEDFSDIKSILNFENWEIADHPQSVYTCGADVAPWHSEKRKVCGRISKDQSDDGRWKRVGYLLQSMGQQIRD